MAGLLLLAFSVTVGASDYTGSALCGSCHQQAYEEWRGSHHDLAMAEAGSDTVLGDFDDAAFSAHGVTSRFFRRDGGWWVNTDGPDGQLHDYRIAYTFGWEPLQQYLVEFPGGRYQALGIAWDSRPAEVGGQRWFHLYPDAAIGPENPLHWTAGDQTWNYQCAECHSTGLIKDYSAEEDGYATRWAEIDVACEACHGPGAAHMAWARAPDGRADKGLAVDLSGGVGDWVIDPDSGRPRRSTALTDDRAIEVCARCHSRRGQTWPDYQHGQGLDQSHRLALLEPQLYHVDGQIKDEVYVYGSFTQSAMYRAGVRCGDCHQQHSLTLRAQGNALCTRCHQAERYDRPVHHHHGASSDGAPSGDGTACTACHMPETRYMGVDRRADHSLRVPRPDLSLTLGTPNACTGCHRDRDAEWAAERVAQWFPDSPKREPHFGQVLHAARRGEADAGDRLLALAADSAAPAIARATAIEALREHANANALLTIGRLLKDPDPLIRREAMRFLEIADVRTQVDLGWELLDDPSRGVRLEAARVLAPLTRQGLPDRYRQQLNEAIDEYIRAQQTNAERAESRLNLGLIHAATNRPAQAVAAYQKAIDLDPLFSPAWVNLADLYRGMGRDQDGERVLRRALRRLPDEASLHHALGLLLIREQRRDEAVAALGRAAELAPQRPRYSYVYALALDSQGRAGEATAVLRAAGQRYPNDREIHALLQQLSPAGSGRTAPSD